MEFHVVTFFLLASTVITVSLAVRAWKYRYLLLARIFIILMFSIALYTAGYGMELASIQLKKMLFWSRIQYIGLPFIPVLYMLLAAEYCGRKVFFKPSVLIALFLIPCVTVVLYYTSVYHNLYYVDPGITLQGSFPLLSFERGPWYLVQAGYGIANLLVGNIIFAPFLFRAALPYRKQALIMISGSLLPWIGYILYIGGFIPSDIDIMPFGLALGGVIYSIGIFRYKLFDLLPVARDQIFESIQDGIFVFDIENRLVDFNPTASVLFPSLESSSIGKNIEELIEKNPEMIIISGDNGQGGNSEITITVGKEPRLYRVQKTPLRKRKGMLHGHVILLQDCTEQVKLMEKLKQLASTDELTGIFNRRQFFVSAQKELSRSLRFGYPMVIIILDLDYFKTINDNFSHAAGDKALKHVADILMYAVRDADISSRYGGEEFAVLLPQTSVKKAGEIAERIRTSLEQSPIEFESQQISITASFGISGGIPNKDTNLEDYIRRADTALYQAKEDGRNKVVVNP